MSTEEAAMREQRFPLGWIEERTRQVLAQYENQTENEKVAEIEAARKVKDVMDEQGEDVHPQ